jgi:hypothetical protein
MLDTALSFPSLRGARLLAIPVVLDAGVLGANTSCSRQKSRPAPEDFTLCGHGDSLVGPNSRRSAESARA